MCGGDVAFLSDYFDRLFVAVISDLYSYLIVAVVNCCAGELPKNHEVLREAYSLCHRLPVMNTAKFREEFYSVNYSC